MYKIYEAKHQPSGNVYIGLTKGSLMERVGQHISLAPDKRQKFQMFLHTTEYNDWTWDVVFTTDNRKLAYETEADLIRDAEARGPILNVQGRIAKGTDLPWLAEHQFKKESKPWNAGKTGVYTEETLDKMRIAKLRKPATKAEYTTQDRQNLRDAQKCKPVKCVETGVEYQSISLAATAMNLNRADIRRVLNGERKNVKGYTFIYVEQQAS